MVFGGEGFWQVVSFVMFFAFIFIYPKMMLSQIVGKLEKDLLELQKMTEKSVKTTVKAMGRPSTEIMPKLRRFMEFFVVSPIDMDPNGIMEKLAKVIRESRGSFRSFVVNNSGITDPAKIKNLEGAVMHTSVNYEIAKIVRHFLGMVKKYKNLQIAMIVSMQMPMIKEMAKSLSKSVEAFVNQDPIGDSIGPLVAAEMIGNGRVVKIKDTDIVYSEKVINGRRCVIAKTDGPGSDVGYPGEAMETIISKFKPSRIITVDAKSKYEGEKTGSLAEGIGVAMGGPGVDRFLIEKATLKINVPVDAIGIKMSQEEAITWMPQEVAKAVPGAISYVKEKIELAPQNGRVIILGVGNTVGIPNGGSLKEVYTKIGKNAKKSKEPKKTFFSKKESDL